jgi:hypothetical protein
MFRGPPRVTQRHARRVGEHSGWIRTKPVCLDMLLHKILEKARCKWAPLNISYVDHTQKETTWKKEMHDENGLAPGSPPTNKKDDFYDSFICWQIARDDVKAPLWHKAIADFTIKFCKTILKITRETTILKKLPHFKKMPYIFQKRSSRSRGLSSRRIRSTSFSRSVVLSYGRESLRV